MTPLIAEMVRMTPDPESGHWFDLGEVPDSIEFILDPEVMVHLPYDVVFIVARALEARMVVKAMFNDDSVRVSGCVFINDSTTQVGPFMYAEKDGGIGVYPEGAAGHPSTMAAMAIIQTLLTRLEAQQTAYKPTIRETFTNRRKIAQGKKPSYDWRTVTVLPRERSDDLGGTHASPRAHDRRGHWRTLKTKKVWVKPCKVGDPSAGQVFHDYKVPA